uniref:pyocin activator PrtN family protein n=1 Tax=Burkholderia multivorans TaxID=87883 RepID=UPI003735752C
MNTVFLLLAQFGARAIIPLDDVRTEYFPHLEFNAMLRKIALGEIGPSSFRVEHNTHNDSWSSSPVGMCAGRWSACAHVHRAGLSR